MTLGNRIIVLGCSGSGKSTLARELHRLTGLPLIHLDNVWWKEDRTHITREEFDGRLQEILKGEKWIIDGDYNRTYEPRFAACDTVVFLDFTEEECMAGITKRVGTVRTDIPWVEQQLDPELVELVRNYRQANRPKVLALAEKYPDRKMLVFTSREQAAEWIAGLDPALSRGGSMRRKDREVTDTQEILRIVEQAKILHLGLADKGFPYVVPLYYGFEYAEGRLIFYIHSAREGHKLDLIRKDPRVCVELECDTELISGGDDPCRYGAAFASVIGQGTAEIVEEEQEKVRALQKLMKHQTGRDFEMDGSMAEKVAVIRITVPEFTAKARKKS